MPDEEEEEEEGGGVASVDTVAISVDAISCLAHPGALAALTEQEVVVGGGWTHALVGRSLGFVFVSRQDPVNEERTCFSEGEAALLGGLRTRPHVLGSGARFSLLSDLNLPERLSQNVRIRLGKASIT